MDLVIENLSKTYPNGVQALERRHPDHPARHVRPARAERRRQVDADAHPRHAAGARRRLASRLGDIDVLREKDDVRRVLGYLPQEFGVYPKVIGRRRCSTTSRPQGASHDAASARASSSALLQQTNLYDVREQSAGQLLRRHAAALRHRPGAARQSEADHRRRAHRRPRSRGARALPQPAGRDRREASSSSSPRTSSPTSATSAAAWRSSTRARCCSTGEPDERHRRAARADLEALRRQGGAGRASQAELTVISDAALAGRTARPRATPTAPPGTASSRSSPTSRTSTSRRITRPRRRA